MDEAKLCGYADKGVRSSLEETLNGLPDAVGEPDLPAATVEALAGAGQYAAGLTSVSWRPRRAR
jgi:hypothetical protein